MVIIVNYRKPIKIVFIIILAIIVLLAAYPGIRNMGLILYMGRANQKYWDMVDDICSKDFDWVDENDEFTLSLVSSSQYGVLTNKENNNFVKFVFSIGAVNFRNDADESLGWAYLSYNEEKQKIVLEIDWFEEKGVFLKEDLLIQEGTVLSFYCQKLE